LEQTKDELYQTLRLIENLRERIPKEARESKLSAYVVAAIHQMIAVALMNGWQQMFIHNRESLPK
jgi:hypothetical protein